MAGLGASLSQLAHTLLGRTPRAPDGLPLPPDKLIHTVAGTKDRTWFWEGGTLGAKTIAELLARRNLTPGQCGPILDFGCGCGRVLRHLAPLAPATRLHGTDYNTTLVRWCQRHLSFAEFSSNQLAPPTRHAEGTFGLIYAFSVFTHLTEPLQHAWMSELRRILQPGGRLIITTHGDRYMEKFGDADRARYARGEVIVWSGDSAGKNRCASFHPPTYVREHLAPAAGLEVLEFVPEGALGNPHQDAWLLQRPQ